MNPGGVQWPCLKSWRAFALFPMWMRWPKMIIANPADWGHASWASDEAWRWGLARRPEHMGVRLWRMGWVQGLPPTRPLTEHVGRGGGEERSWSNYAVGLMASGWDPLHALPAMQLRTGQGGPRAKEIQTDSHRLVLKPRRNLPSQQQGRSPGFYSPFDTPSRVKWSADPLRVCLGLPLLLGQIELHNISVSQVDDFGWDSQRFCEHCERLSTVVGQLQTNTLIWRNC